MAVEALSDIEQGLRAAIEALLREPPSGVPEPLVAALQAAWERSRGGVPAHVFMAVVEQAPIAVSITDLAAHIIYANPAFTRVTGYSLDEVRGHNESLLSDKNTPLRVYQDLWDSLTAGRVWQGALVNRRKDGTRYLAQLMVTPVLGADGKATHYLGMHRDISEEHSLELKVRNQKTLIESMVNAAPFVMALLDERGQVVLDNLAYKTLAADMGGQEPAKVFFDKLEDPNGHALDWKRRKGFADRELSCDPGGGRRTRWFSCSGTWFEQREEGADNYFARSDKRFLLFVAKEISDLKQEQEKVRANALRALVAEQERLGGVREILGGALYQLQGPINLLNAAVNLVERRQGHGDSGTDHTLASVMHQAVAAGREAIEMLERALPQVADEPLVPVNLNQLMRDVMTICTARLLAQGVIVDWQPTSILPTLMGYENRLRRAIKHLVENALDAMSAAHVPTQELRVATIVGDDRYLQVVIADNGPGIPEQLRYKVFEPFFTTRRGHSGMGLAQVQDVLNEHSGTIEIADTEGGGCQVTVTLPLSPERNRL